MAGFALALAGASSACASIVNGSFESGTQDGTNPTVAVVIPGWTIGGNGVERFEPTPYGLGAAADGTWVVDLAFFSSGNGRISQVLPVIPNAYYDITFALGNALAFGRDGTGVVDVFIDGTPYSFNTPTATSSDILWANQSVVVQASGPTLSVEYANTQDPNSHFAFLDNVNVTETTAPDGGTGGAGGALHTPEPASVIAWSTLGLLGAAVSLWRRR
jgi:hypothetical protein